MKLVTTMVLAAALLSGAVLAKDNAELDKLKGLAAMIGVDVKTLTFRDEHQKSISAKEFNVLVDNKRSFDIVKDAGVTVLVINKPEPDAQPTNKETATKRKSNPIETFPDFNLMSTQRQTLSLQDFEGKPTLFSFYYSTCIPCIQEVPVLNELKSQLNKQVNFMAITFEEMEVAKGFAAKYRFEWESMVGAEALVQQVGVPAYPAFVLLDANGAPLNVRIGNAKHNTVEALTQWMADSGVSL